MNFFSKGGENSAVVQDGAARDDIKQIEEDMACLIEQDLFMNDDSADVIRAVKPHAKKTEQDSDDKEVEDLFRDSSDSNPPIDSANRRKGTNMPA